MKARRGGVERSKEIDMNTQTQELTETKTSSNWLDDYSQHVRSHCASRLTVISYLQEVRSFVAWFEQTNQEAFTPDLLNGTDIREYARRCMAVNKPSTWNHKRTVLKSLCDWALESGFLTYNPFRDIPLGRSVDLAPRWLDRSAYSRLTRHLELATNSPQTDARRRQAVRDQALVSLMLYAGLRVAEAVALDTPDLEISERKGRVIIRHGKGDKRREVPLGSDVRRALAAWLAIRGGTPGPVFGGKNSDRITTRQVQRIVESIGQACQLDVGSTPHRLRHTCAKRLLDNGAPLTVVSKILGHGSLNATVRYTLPGWDDLEAAVNN
jgi:site-specific recombinase XerC